MINVSINLIWRNFLDRGFFVFRWVKKKVLSVLFGHFCADLKNIFNIYMISKSYVATNFGQELIHFFRDLNVCFWEKLNLQTFRKTIFVKNFHKIFGAHPARVRLQASEIGRYLLQNRKFTLSWQHKKWNLNTSRHS